MTRLIFSALAVVAFAGSAFASNRGKKQQRNVFKLHAYHYYR